MNNIADIVNLLSVVSFMLMAGLYFIFSNTIMKALSQMSGTSGAEAMARINEVILNPIFFTFFFGSAVCAGYLIFDSLVNEFEINKLAAGVMFFFGSFLSTVVFNVPLNNKLKSAVDTQRDIKINWDQYLDKWTKWNTSRTIFSLLSAVLLLIG